MKKSAGLLVAAAAICCGNASASEPVEGTFSAIRACEAYTSFARGRNPGLVKVQPDQVYEAVEVNKKTDWDWIRISVNNDLRWVAKECGRPEIKIAAQSDDSGGGGGGGRRNCTTPNQHDSYVLAMSWQPGFCEHPPRNDKPECSAMNEGELSVSNLTLHGLWPNKQECGTSYGNCADTPLVLTEQTMSELAPWMPNCYFSDPQCKFAEYEWKKHGTCQERDDDAYFMLAKGLVERVDKSEIGLYLKNNLGNTINAEEYRKHIEETMGKDVADRVRLLCTQGKYLQEIRISLPKDIMLSNDIASMVAGAKSFEGRFAPNCSSKDVYIERSGKD